MLELILAISLHVGISGDQNSIHPGAVYTHDEWKAGAFLNSYEEISFFAGRRFGNKYWSEVGIVTGYDYPIGARFGTNLNDSVSLWAIPAPESLVIGMEVRFDGILRQ